MCQIAFNDLLFLRGRHKARFPRDLLSPPPPPPPRKAVPFKSCSQVSFISQDCEEIPEFLGTKYGHMAKRLDLSFNLLRYVAMNRDVLLWKSAPESLMATVFDSLP
ncbi:unnamed protein product [Bubo scandiacus]